MMTGDDLVALLGQSSDTPTVLQALSDFGIRWPPRLEDPLNPEEEQDWYVWRPSSKQGVEFGFQDEAHLYALDPALRGKSRLMLCQVYFYSEHDGILPYQGVLPFDLLLQDTRVEAERKLSQKFSVRRSYQRDTWEHEDKAIIIHYQGDTLKSILCKIQMSDWPALDPPPLLPSLSNIIALFGLPWHAPGMQQHFFPLGLASCGREVALHRYADLRKQIGVELYFFRDSTRAEDSLIKNKGACFSAIKFFYPRYQDARGWAGELPLGLTFAMSYPTVVQQLGAAPDEHAEGDLKGYGVWHDDAYTLHILYDTVDNVLLCVGLFSPGSWRAP